MSQKPGNHRRDVSLPKLGDLLPSVERHHQREVAFASLSDLKWGELPEGEKDHRFTPKELEVSRQYWFDAERFYEPNQFIHHVNQLPLFKEMNAQLLADIPHALGYFQEHKFKNAPDSLMQQIWARVEKSWFVSSADRLGYNGEPKDLLEASVGLQKLRASAPTQTEIPAFWQDTMNAVLLEMLPDGTEKEKPDSHPHAHKNGRNANLPRKKAVIDVKNINTEAVLKRLNPNTAYRREKMNADQVIGVLEAWIATPGMKLAEKPRATAFAYLIAEMASFDHAELTRSINVAAALDYAPAEFMVRWETGVKKELGNFTLDEQLSCMDSLNKLGKKEMPEFAETYQNYLVVNASKLDDETLARIIKTQQGAARDEALAEYIVRNIDAEELPPLTADIAARLGSRLPRLDHVGLSRILSTVTDSGFATGNFLMQWETAAKAHREKFTPQEHLSNMACFRMEDTKASHELRSAYWNSMKQNLNRLGYEGLMEVLHTAADQGSPVSEQLLSSYAKEMDLRLPTMASSEAVRVLWDLAAISVTTPLPENVLDLAHEMMPIAEMDKAPPQELRQMRSEAFQRFFPTEIKKYSALKEPEEKLAVSNEAKSFYDGLWPAEEELGLSVMVEDEQAHAFRIKGRYVRIEIDNASNVVPDSSGKPTTYTGKTLLQTARDAEANPDGVFVRLDKSLAKQMSARDGHDAERFESFKREVVKLYPGAYKASYDVKRERIDLEPMEIPPVPVWTPAGFQHQANGLNKG